MGIPKVANESPGKVGLFIPWGEKHDACSTGRGSPPNRFGSEPQRASWLGRGQLGPEVNTEWPPRKPASQIYIYIYMNNRYYIYIRINRLYICNCILYLLCVIIYIYKYAVTDWDSEWFRSSHVITRLEHKNLRPSSRLVGCTVNHQAKQWNHGWSIWCYGCIV